MDDRQARTWDTTIKVVGVLLAVAGFWDGIRRYNEGRVAEARSVAERARQAALVAVRDSRKPFLERQLALYFEATKVTAQLSTLPRGVAWTAARQRFWELYWGELGLVEDTSVLAAMVAFGEAVTAYEQGRNSQADLHQLALGLARACRNSLQSEWGGLDTLPSRPASPRPSTQPN
jgi:hypothetical protein